jgi:hypothetical protein
MQIEWTDEDSATGQKRYVRAEKFARKWSFRIRFRRRTEWEPVQVTREMLETLLDALERRYTRREGVTDEDLKQVRAALAAWKPPPTVEEDISPQRGSPRSGGEASTKGHKEDARERTEENQPDSTS